MQVTSTSVTVGLGIAGAVLGGVVGYENEAKKAKWRRRPFNVLSRDMILPPLVCGGACALAGSYMVRPLAAAEIAASPKPVTSPWRPLGRGLLNLTAVGAGAMVGGQITGGDRGMENFDATSWPGLAIGGATAAKALGAGKGTDALGIIGLGAIAAIAVGLCTGLARRL